MSLTGAFRARSFALYWHADGSVNFFSDVQYLLFLKIFFNYIPYLDIVQVLISDTDINR